MAKNTETMERYDIIKRRMSTAPLVFPYADFSKYHAIESAYGRLFASVNILSPERLKKLDLADDHLPTFLLCIHQATKYVLHQLMELGISEAEASARCGIPESVFSKCSSGELPSPLGADELVALSTLLPDSSNKVLFGEDGKILLPGVYSSVAAAFSNLSHEQKKEELAYAACIIDTVRTDT